MSRCRPMLVSENTGAARLRALDVKSLVSLSILTVLMTFSGLAALPTQALESDRDQQIEIESDRAEFREKEGITVYSGNVRMSQGSMLLTADNMKIYTADGDVNKLVATGNRAYFEQLPAEDQQKVVAQGEMIEYILADDVINLVGQASITQEGATLNGNRITYDVRNHLLKANSASSSGGANTSGSSNSGERVKVVIPSFGPRNNSTPETSAD